MRRARTVAAISCGALALSPVGARVPGSLGAAVKARAVRANFDGTILIGDSDGSSVAFSLPRGAPPLNAAWRYESITKQLAAVLAMQEVERGRIDLDAPVARYWPDWRAPDAGRIRIRDLLLHNSGLPQPDQSPADADGIPAFYRSKAVSAPESAGAFCAGPPRAAPPASFEYNNCDSIVLAEVLARVTGKPFEQLVRERLAIALGMRSLRLYRVGTPRREQVHPTGEYSQIDPLIDLGVYGASGGAYGTIGDLWKFDHALLGNRLLSKASKETMWHSTRKNGFYGFHQWIYPAPLRGCAKPVRIVERQGLIGGIELRNYLLPERGRALIMFSRHRPTNLGDPWEGKGFAFDLLSRVGCSR